MECSSSTPPCIRGHICLLGTHAKRLAPKMWLISSMANACFTSHYSQLPKSRHAPSLCPIPVQIILDVLESLPVTPSPPAPEVPSSRNSPFPRIVAPGSPSPPPPTPAAKAILSLRMWLCATLQPVIDKRPRAIQAFLASRGIPLVCRQLAAGPADVAMHSCGVLASALTYDRSLDDAWLDVPEAGVEAVEVGLGREYAHAGGEVGGSASAVAWSLCAFSCVVSYIR